MAKEIILGQTYIFKDGFPMNSEAGGPGHVWKVDGEKVKILFVHNRNFGPKWYTGEVLTGELTKASYIFVAECLEPLTKIVKNAPMIGDGL